MMYYWCDFGGGGLRTGYDGSMSCSESSHDRHWCRHGDGRWYCLFGWSQPAGAKRIDRSGEILRSREVLWPNVVVVSLAPSESLPMVHSWYGWSTVGIGIDDESMNRLCLGQQWLQHYRFDGQMQLNTPYHFVSYNNLIVEEWCQQHHALTIYVEWRTDGMNIWVWSCLPYFHFVSGARKLAGRRLLVGGSIYYHGLFVKSQKWHDTHFLTSRHNTKIVEFCPTMAADTDSYEDNAAELHP